MAYVRASDGNMIDPDSLAQTLHRTDGVVDYVEVTSDGITYRQTLTYTDGVVTGVSKWVKQ